MPAMNPKTTVYLLFREYVDAQKVPTCPYIRGRELDATKLTAEIWTEVQPQLSILKFFGHERMLVLYDRKNLGALLYPATALTDEYPGLRTTVLAQIKDKYTSWDDCPSKSDNLTYTTETGYDISNDMLGDMARRQHYQVAPCALLQKDAIDTDKADCVNVVCSDRSAEQLMSFHDVKGFHKWVSENRQPKRTYHFNPKHGDANRHRNREEAAQLLTDEAMTNELLKYAVGRDQESELWYYDVNNGCYIYFENEGNTPQLGFHAYHIHSGEENFENIDICKLCIVQEEILSDKA